mmetsp:Transcript_20996/g.62826  ORF Transcript_20996/g.62826 Transcript_20996/m.62826 type:complete len:236 (-) Transcript_20996:3-710(-)
MLVMEYESGRSLMEILQESGGLPEFAVRQIVSQVISVLGHVHQLGYVYVDLKPENIWLMDDDAARNLALRLTRLTLEGCHRFAIKLFDYDLCRSTSKRSFANSSGDTHSQHAEHEKSGSQEQRHFFWGTLDYVAPEVIERGYEGYSDASDWWSVGVLAFECIYAKSPFAAPSQERTIYNIKMKAPTFPEVPKVRHACKDFVRTLLRQRIDYRLGCKNGVQDLIEHEFLKEEKDMK